MTRKISKAILPVAGLGTRMLPATKAIPKEMLPIVDKPIIQYIVQEAYEAGIKEIILVTHASKNSIENHFDVSFELESTLEKRLKRQLLNEVRSISPKDNTLIHVRQGISKGLGHAISCAKPIANNEAVAILLPDVLIDEFGLPNKRNNLAEMLKRYEETGASQVMVEEVPHHMVEKFGIVDLNGKKLKAGEFGNIHGMVEKPTSDTAPSNLSIVGRYVLSNQIWSELESTMPGAGEEIQLTDAIAAMISKSSVEAYYLKGQSFDCGDKLGYMKANFEYGLRHPVLGKNLQTHIENKIFQDSISHSAGKSLPHEKAVEEY